jgi:aspartate carbamoyltransferase catalytic subunit
VLGPTTPLSRNRHLLTVGDLGLEELTEILDRSEEHRKLYPAAPRLPRGMVFGLFFFQPSTRTRLGFQAAAGHLGATPVELSETRHEPGMSEGEDLLDAFRSVAGYCNAIVLRHRDEETFHRMLEASPSPVINGGCGTLHHPSQALIDLFYIRARLGRLDGLRIGIAGDLAGSRSARSLVAALRLLPVRELRIMAPADRQLEASVIGDDLAQCLTRSESLVPRGLDILYMAGFPAGVGADEAPASLRWRFRLTRELAQTLPPSALILSPLPRIDEIARDVDDLPQAAYFDQSRCGLFVRMALLERAVMLRPGY